MDVDQSPCPRKEGADLARALARLRPPMQLPKRRANQSLRSTLLDCGIAMGGVALALLARKLLDGLFQDRFPFVTFIVAVMIAAWTAGILPALLTMILGAVGGLYFFIQPRGSLLTHHQADYIGTILYCVVGAVAIVLSEANRQVRKRLEAANESIQLQQEELRRQMEERSAVERSLRAAEERFRRLSESNIIGIITVDCDGRIADANDEFLRMLGYDRAQFERLRPSWRDLTPEDWTEHDDRAMQELRDTGTCKVYEKEYLHSDGVTRVPVLMGGARFNPPEPGGIAFVLDLSALNRARHTLQLQSRILENMAEGVVVTDTGGVIIFTNAAMDQLFAYERGELNGQQISMLLTLDDAERKELVEEIALALRVRGHWNGELSSRRKDGSAFISEGYITAMGSYWVCVQTDITQRKRVESMMQEADERLTLAMEAAAMGTWELDATEDRLLASTNLRSVLPSEIESQWVAMKDVYPAIHPDDRQRVRQAIADALAGVREYDVEFRGRRKDGVTHWLHSRGKVFRDGQGRALRMTGVTVDVTNRRAAEQHLHESEQRLRLAQEASSSGVWDWGLEKNEIHGSEEFCRVYGVPNAPTFDFALWLSMIHPEDRGRVDQLLRHAVASGEDFDFAFRIIHPDRGERWIATRGRAVRGGDGRVVRMIGINIDITRRKRAELELQKAKEVAEAADRAKDHFLAVLSHELRTPLTPVLGAVELLSDDPSMPQAARADLYMIRRNIELEARLIDDLLDLTRVARSKIDLNLQPCDAHLAVQRVLEICRPEIDQKRLALETDLKAMKSTLMADPARLQQIVWNLLKNAVKFTPLGGSIRVRSSCDEKQITIEVSDTGIGIAPAALGKIFNAFEQADRDITRRFGGLGLGLAISKALTDLHGGELTAASDGEGLGSTFTLRLALATSSQSQMQVQPPDAAPAPPVAALTRGNPLRILLVEDHLDTARVMSRLLLSCGHHVSTAGNIADALHEASSKPFDLVISDLGLPDGSGHDLMRELLSRGDALKGIAVSGFGMETDLQRSREAGFAEHLTKPIDLERLERVISRVANA